MFTKRSRAKRKPKSKSRLLNCLKWLFLGKKPEPMRGKAKQKPVCDLGEDYYSAKEVASALGVSVSALCGYRRTGTGPKYVIFGYRNYRYPRAELLKYIKEMTRASTSATRNYDYNPNEQKG